MQHLTARRVHVRGVVQGVGFRPLVSRLAGRYGLTGWVRNTDAGVQIHVEGAEPALAEFLRELEANPPPAARIDRLELSPASPEGHREFAIRESERADRPTVRISPDLAVCPACLAELCDSADRRHAYPYINCTGCGPRYSIVLDLPYDRPATTMADWPMCAGCAAEYRDPADRRFHAQPVACPACGPRYLLVTGEGARHETAIAEAARLLRAGRILGVKGIGGYHLACDARDPGAVERLRERKFRKEKPFGLMVRDLETARTLVELSAEAEALLTSVARPIVLAPARVRLAGVAPENADLGVMLAYAPLHHLLFECGAPEVLVMTSGNRSSEPIAYRDEEAVERLAGIADALLVGQRPIARRVEDSVVRVGAAGPSILRRSRGYAPATVARLPAAAPILAVGADLKSAVTLVLDGDALVSQHLGDLEHFDAYRAFRETIDDLMAMYDVDWAATTVVHDLHPEYLSTAHARTLPAARWLAVQHHRAHAASVLAERDALDVPVVAAVYDGTGYGDDGTIWGGEFLVGSLTAGLRRVAHLRPALLPGGDAAAHHPVQAAAGFLVGLDGLPDLEAPPFSLPPRYRRARRLAAGGTRTFETTSAGRLFDTVAALLGFTREVTYEGQAAIWLEHLARAGRGAETYPAPYADGELDHRPLLLAVIEERARGRAPAEVARAFHRGLAAGTVRALRALCEEAAVDRVVLSGGVFQNDLLLHELRERLAASGLDLWTNRAVPPNDGGVSLGQAALAATGCPG